jgi:hypothetical protein
MTKEDILMMARNTYGIYAFTAEDLSKFAGLVAADEREACAKVCEENSNMFGDSALIGVCRTNAKRIRARGMT